MQAHVVFLLVFFCFELACSATVRSTYGNVTSDCDYGLATIQTDKSIINAEIYYNAYVQKCISDGKEEGVGSAQLEIDCLQDYNSTTTFKSVCKDAGNKFCTASFVYLDGEQSVQIEKAVCLPVDCNNEGDKTILGVYFETQWCTLDTSNCTVSLSCTIAPEWVLGTSLALTGFVVFSLICIAIFAHVDRKYPKKSLVDNM